MADRTMALIGGSSFDSGWLPGMAEITGSRRTPYGEASSPVWEGILHGRRVLFLLRHGEGHRYPPHAVPSPANLWALREAGADEVVAVATVGGISPRLGPGAIVIPDDLVDCTRGRASTIYTGPETGVRHIDFTRPFDEGVRARLGAAAGRAGIPVESSGVYWCTEGPRLETAAEVRAIRALGGDMVGMTACPEAAVARELGLPYALVSLSVNWAAGIAESASGIDFALVAGGMEEKNRSVRALLDAFVAGGC